MRTGINNLGPVDGTAIAAFSSKLTRPHRRIIPRGAFAGTNQAWDRRPRLIRGRVLFVDQGRRRRGAARSNGTYRKCHNAESEQLRRFHVIASWFLMIGTYAPGNRRWAQV
jgi:hypothetical protein